MSSRSPARALAATLALMLAAAPALAGSGSSLAPRLAETLRGPGLDQARTGAFVVDLSSGRPLFALNAGRSLVPASNEKLPLTYAALVELGPAFRIPTEVRGEGRLIGATWRGNLVLKGYGDPTLSSQDLRRLALRIRGLGIRRVTGSIVGDESYFDRNRMGPGWRSSFYRTESPPLSALAVDRAETRTGVARRPALVAAQRFLGALREAGIGVQGPAKAVRAGGQPLVSVFSPPLSTILHVMDRDSDNYRAELLLKVLGGHATGLGTSARGAAVVRRVLRERGIPLAGVRVADGSGLSSLDHVTPRALAAILVQAWQDPGLRPAFVRALAVAGRDGTLRHRFLTSPVRGSVRAKTGTTTQASALSGFVRDRYAFVVIQNGTPVSTWAAHRAQDRFVELLAAQ
jgi:D-alanyl-D-alanine carboxypeptidase/D-alanyl-D-alanine-endopeptidase (penicillin-binding protein 4)